MDTGYRFGLLMLYSVMAVYVLLMLRILIQILFGAAIEDRRRRQWRAQHGGTAHSYRAMVGKGGWSNRWLPRSAEVNRPAPKVKATGGRAALPLLVTSAIVLVFLLIALGLGSTVAAQQRSDRDVSASELKKQLIDVQAKEIQLRIRLEEIEQELKPESIERELAGIGSVHPEELREYRRKLLTIERNGLQAQLDLLEEDRARIEAEILVAEEPAAYLNYLQPAPPKPSPQPQMAMALRNLDRAELPLRKIFGALAISVLLTGGLILLLFVGIQKLAQWGNARTPAVTNDGQAGNSVPLQTMRTAAIPRCEL